MGGKGGQKGICPSTSLIGLGTCPSGLAALLGVLFCPLYSDRAHGREHFFWELNQEAREKGAGEEDAPYASFPHSISSSTPRIQPELKLFQCPLQHPLFSSGRQGGRKQAGVKLTSSKSFPAMKLC